MKKFFRLLQKKFLAEFFVSKSETDSELDTWSERGY